jgi:hypothetical protein
MSEQPIKPVIVRAEQDQAIADSITAARQLIETARTDPEIAPLLAARGYDAAKLADGLKLQETAQAAFTARQQAIAAQKQATAALTGASLTARQTYTDFRETARALFTAVADRVALGLKGNAPDDTQKFITLAQASYTTARTEPYRSALAAYGYTTETIAQALATLDALIIADETQNIAIGAAHQATLDRNTAHKTLLAWLAQFKRIAKVTLRTKPALAKKLLL